MDSKPISMKELSKSKFSNWKIILITVILTLLVVFAGNSINEKFIHPDITKNAKIITLKDVVIAYAPEIKSIIFINRQTGQVDFALSDSVSLAVFTIKSGEIVSDYSSKVSK